MSYSPPESCDPPARVTVAGTRIPVINDGIRTEMVRDAAVGEGYITKHSEVYFPAVWPFKLNDDEFGRDYLATIDALDPENGTNYDYADVEIRDHRTGEFVLIHRGFVMGVGGGARGNIERRITIGDAGQMLNTIGITSEMETYTKDTPLQKPLEDVVAKLDELTDGIFGSVRLGQLSEEITMANIGDEGDDAVAKERADGIIGKAQSLVRSTNRYIGLGITGTAADKTGAEIRDGIIRNSKTFEPSRDTAADVLAWVQRRVDGYFEIIPDGETGLMLTHNKGADKGQFEATHLDGNTEVLVNNALYETKPVNTVLAKGEEDDGQIPYALVTVPKLLEAANGNQYLGTIHETDSTSLNYVRSQAKKELKNRIQGASLGRIVTLPTPITPHNNIISQPNCGQIVDETPELSWEVDKLVHNISATEEDDEYRHQTELKVSPSVLLGEETKTTARYADQGQPTSDVIESLKAQFD